MDLSNLQSVQLLDILDEIKEKRDRLRKASENFYHGGYTFENVFSDDIKVINDLDSEFQTLLEKIAAKVFFCLR